MFLFNFTFIMSIVLAIIEAKVMKRAWFSNSNDIDSLNNPNSYFHNNVEWRMSRWTLGAIDPKTGLPNDMEHVIVLAVPYENGQLSQNAPQLRIEIVAQQDKFDSVTNTWTGEQEIAIRARTQNEIPPRTKNGVPYNQFGKISTFHDTGYNIVGRVYTLSNNEYGIEAKFPPTSASNDLTTTVDTYRSRTNDCQTGAIKIMNAIFP